MIPLESPVPEIGPPGSESGGRKRTHGTRPAARLRKRRISHRPLPATRLSSTLRKVQIRPPKGVIGAGMGLGHRRLQAEPGLSSQPGGHDGREGWAATAPPAERPMPPRKQVGAAQRVGYPARAPSASAMCRHASRCGVERGRCRTTRRTERTTWTPSFSSLSERVKSGHLWTPQIRPFRRPETGVEFYFTASCVCKVVWILVRQLRGPHFSTCA